MSDFIKVANKNEIKENSMKAFEISGKRIMIANLGGEFFAVNNNCTHEEGFLSDGEVVGGCCVECPIHGARFDLRTGTVKALPATEPLKTYEIKIEGDNLFVNI